MAKRPSSAYEDLEDLLAHDDKAKEKITTTKGEHHRSISREKTTVSDPYFEEPIAKLNETTKLSIFSTNQPSQFAKTQLKLSTPLEGVVEDNSPILNSFGRTQADISKVSDDQFLSMRNMKPPLRKRDSAQMNLSIGVGLVIPEEPVSSQADSEKLLSPPKLKSRRSSIESRVD